MTCFEKLLQDRPMSKETASEYIHWNCPSWYGYLDYPKYCDNSASLYLCDRCWNREIEEADV